MGLETLETRVNASLGGGALPGAGRAQSMKKPSGEGWVVKLLALFFFDSLSEFSQDEHVLLLSRLHVVDYTLGLKHMYGAGQQIEKP